LIFHNYVKLQGDKNTLNWISFNHHGTIISAADGSAADPLGCPKWSLLGAIRFDLISMIILNVWLVVTGTMEFYIVLWHFYILGIILPTDELILFRGVGIPPTRCALFNLGAIILQVVISLEAKWSQGWPLKMATTLMAAGHWFLSRRLFFVTPIPVNKSSQ